ncbi:MAG: 50S ribosomal protein L18 [Bacteroidetes bacterium]|nr:50S ribosomal protein L18 [Bacteroidota bacterium]
MANKKLTRRERIRFRIRKKFSGTADHPRFSVFRSNKEIYAQVIDDRKRITLISASSTEKDYEKAAPKKVSKTEQAKIVGALLCEKALKTGITSVVFDRNGYLYHGRVKALADSARKGGLKF